MPRHHNPELFLLSNQGCAIPFLFPKTPESAKGCRGVRVVRTPRHHVATSGHAHPATTRSPIIPHFGFKTQLQIPTLRQASARDIEGPSRPMVISSTACGRDAEIGTANFPIRSVSPLKGGPNDIAIFPSRDWSVEGDTINWNSIDPYTRYSDWSMFWSVHDQHRNSNSAAQNRSSNS